MSFLDEEIKPSSTALVPVVEFAVAKIPQNKSALISPTTSSWDRYAKRKEIVENNTYDFLPIMHGMRQDGYIARTLSKYVNSIFLRGYKNVTLKPAIDKYLRMRLQMIVDAMPDHNHIDDFFQAIARDLVAFSNVYILKQRKKQKYLPQGIKIEGVPRLKPNGQKENQDPVVAYELLHPASIHVIRDMSGNVLRYEQWPLFEYAVKNQRPQDKKLIRRFDPHEVVHVAIDRDDGFPYGIPFLHSVLDDIRILRTLEDHVSRLAFRFAFPFTQVKIGTDKPGFQASEEELEFYKKMVYNAPPDATMVTNEKVEFNVVGAEGQAIQLEPYLEHFKSRAFSGLGVSAVSMGEGDTSNRSTADAMTTEMHDQIKHFQNVFSRNITQEIYREILLEGGYDWYNDPDKNWAMLVFEDIEVESNIARESHYIQLLLNNGITFSEFRKLTGRQPMTDKEWTDTYLVKFALPQIMVKLTGTDDLDEHGELMLQKHKLDMKMGDAQHKNALKDIEVKDAEIEATKADTEGAKAQAGAHQVVTTGQSVKRGPDGSKSVSTTKSVKTPVTAPKGHFQGDPDRGPSAKPKVSGGTSGNKTRPANQHGTRKGPKRKTESEEQITPRTVNLKTRVTGFSRDLHDMYAELKESIVDQAHLNLGKNVDNAVLVELLFELTKGRLASMSAKYLVPSFYQGMAHFQNDTDVILGQNMWVSERTALTEFNEKTINRLVGDLLRPVARLVKKSNEKIEKAKEAGKDLQVDMRPQIEEIFEKNEYRLEFIANTEVPQSFWFGYASAAHYHNVELDLVREDDACADCLKASTTWANSSSARRRMALSPTLHPNCECSLVPRGDPETPEEDL